MKPVVPFISNSSAGERMAWYSALPEALKGIADFKPFAELIDEDKQLAKVAIVANPDPVEVASLPNLVWIQSLWAGVERLTNELPEDSPLIVRLEDPQMADTMSEAVLAWTLFLHRDMPTYSRQQKQKEWREHELKLPQEVTVGVLGLGNLGRASAQRLTANGFEVLGWSRGPKDLEGLATFHGQEGLGNVLQRSDILVLLMPLTSETRGLINSTTLGQCKPGAKLINFARGPIIDDEALLAALDDGKISHAVLDVFSVEPLPEDHRYWSHQSVTVLPHISAPTITSTASRIVAENLKAYFTTGSIPKHVDRKRGY